MKEKITIGLAFKRTRIVVDVHLRPHILARHRALAAVCAYPTLDAYFSDLVGRDRIDDALDYVVNPAFAGFTAVEFAQEQLDTAFGGVATMPWGGDPVDMPIEQFLERIEEWASTFESPEHRLALNEAAHAAIEGNGERVRALVEPAKHFLARQVIDTLANESEETT